MTQGTPPAGGNSAADNNETVALRRGDLPPAQPQHGQPAQPQYGQPAQPQQSYAPPPQAYGQSPQGQQYGAPTPPYHQQPQGGRQLGTVGLVLALVGGVLAAVGLFAVRWTKIGAVSDSLTQPKFLSLRKLIVALDDASRADDATFTVAYFKYAAFVLLAVALVFAILAALPTGATPVLRVLGFVVGLVSAAAAAFVPALDDTDGLSEYLKGGVGLYLVAAGSLVMAVAALIGSRKRASPARTA